VKTLNTEEKKTQSQRIIGVYKFVQYKKNTFNPLTPSTPTLFKTRI